MSKRWIAALLGLVVLGLPVGTCLGGGPYPSDDEEGAPTDCPTNEKECVDARSPYLHLIGDLGITGFYRTTRFQNGQPVNTVVPKLARGTYRVGENESPRVVNRVFLTYNYYNGINGGTTPDFDIHRQVFGIEKTFAEGHASLGVRVPYLQVPGAAVGKDDLGDLSLLFKWMLFDDSASENVISTGVMVNVPTAGRRLTQGAFGAAEVASLTGTAVDPDLQAFTTNGRDRGTVLQPFLGYIWYQDWVSLHGFSSLVVPVGIEEEPTAFNADIALNFECWSRGCDRFISTITPTIELHLTTPLERRGTASVFTDPFDRTVPRSPTGYPDLFTVTTGAHLGIAEIGTMTLGVALPISGPKQHNAEGIFQLNLLF